MKKLFTVVYLGIFLLAFQGCGQKDMPKATGSGGGTRSAYFFSDTRWTGVANTYGQTYPQPFCLQFNSDTTVTVHCLFAWIDGNNIVWHDSTTGKITDIDTITNGQTTISVTYPLSNDQQTFTFPDKNSITGGSIATSMGVLSSQYTFKLQLNPAVIAPVNGSTFNTELMINNGPTNGGYTFPDINGISFVENNKMTYFRNGKSITYTPPTQDQLLIEGYQQDGPLLYFAGYNEEQNLIIQYFGVLSADGKIIFADTRNRINTRLPNYLQTIYWYGSPGITPFTTKAN